MDSEYWERLQDHFCTALELPAAERAAYLDRLSGLDPGLHAEVRAMLEAHDDTGALRVEASLLAPPAEAGADAASGTERQGTRAGAWRLLRLLGRGGMGEVWLAERADGAFAMQAAVKLVHSGWRRAELVRRFERERQLLARLEHPNIARLLDGGSTDDGVPFLAMEYVDGETITEWCDARRLGIADRLRLFRTVCEAVRFAHHNLIVHRDLKPANILVTDDGRPVLLDFGIARLLDPGETGGGLTRAEERLLTPECAAPEQLRGEAATTATDVWGLGVLLYQLLVGVRPFSRGGTTTRDIERRVLTEDPPRPALTALAPPPRDEGSAEDRAARRGTTPKALSRQLRGDLEPIVLSALRKEPARRYPSAGELGDDVGRWLDGRPVHAQADSFRYRTIKYVGRNPWPVALLLLLFAGLAAFSWFATAQTRRVSRERDRAEAERLKSDRVLSMLIELFEVSNPTVHPGGDTLRVGELVTIAETRIAAMADQPDVQARLWQAVADIQLARSRPREAEAACRRGIALADSLGLVDQALVLRHLRARCVFTSEGPRAAEPLFRASLADYRRRYGERHHDTTEAMLNLADCLGGSDEAFALLRRSLAIRREILPMLGIAEAGVLNGLGTSHWARQEYEEARSAFIETAEALRNVVSGTDHRYLTVQQNIVACDGALGNFDRAIDQSQSLLRLQLEIHGADSPAVARSLMNIGIWMVMAGRFGPAADTLEQALRLHERLSDPEHPELVNCARNLAFPLVRLGREAEAWPLMERALDYYRRTFGPQGSEAAFQEMLNGLARISAGQRVAPEESAGLVARYRGYPEDAGRQNLSDALAYHALVLLLDGGPGSAEAAGRALDEGIPLFGRRVPESHPAHASAVLLRELARFRVTGHCDTVLFDRLFPRVAGYGLNPPAAVEALRRMRDAS